MLKKGRPFIALAHFINWQNIGMIEVGRSLSFAPEAHQRVLGISVVRQNALERHDPTRMPLSRPINYAHPAASDFFQNLIIAQKPIPVLTLNFAEQVVQRWLDQSDARR